MPPGALRGSAARRQGPGHASSRSRRPGRSSSQVSRLRSRRGWPGGSTVPGYSASTAGPSTASKPGRQPAGELELRARSLGRERAVPGLPEQLARRWWLAGPATPCRRPTYSSSVPAMASGTIGAPVRSAISAAPWRNGPIRPAGPLTVPSGIWTNTAPLRDHGAGRRDVAVDADPAAPDRQQPADAVDQPLAPARGERRRRAAEEPAPRLLGQRVHHDERVHPAPVGRADQQVAAARAGAPGRSRRSGTGTRRRARTGRPAAGTR